MKLIIDIPDKTIAHIRADYGHNYKGLCDEDRDIIVKEIYNGVPLEDIKEQYDKGYKDGVKETFIEELEKIKTEGLKAKPYYQYYIEKEDFISILDKHIAELKGIVDRIEEPVKKALSELKGENNAE